MVFLDCDSASFAEGWQTIRPCPGTCRWESPSPVFSQSWGREQCFGTCWSRCWVWCRLQRSHADLARSKNSNPWIHGGGSVWTCVQWCCLVLYDSFVVLLHSILFFTRYNAYITASETSVHSVDCWKSGTAWKLQCFTNLRLNHVFFWRLLLDRLKWGFGMKRTL